MLFSVPTSSSILCFFVGWGVGGGSCYCCCCCCRQLLLNDFVSRVVVFLAVLVWLDSIYLFLVRVLVVLLLAFLPTF